MTPIIEIKIENDKKWGRGIHYKNESFIVDGDSDRKRKKMTFKQIISISWSTCSYF